MKKTTVIWILVIVAIVAVIWRVSAPKTASAPETGAMSGGSSVTTSVPKQPDSVQPVNVLPKSVAVDIIDSGFAPRTLNVAKGATVTWTNRDSMPHTVSSFPGGPSSVTLAKGASYSFTFKTSGTVNYHCSIHPGMTGTVFVAQ